MKIKKFTPCPVDDGEEMYPNGIFVFNITKMAEYIKIYVKDFSRGSSKFNEDHLPTVDVSKPVIVAEISPGRYNVIDGNHRMEKARRLGIGKVQAHKLSPEHHLQFLTKGTSGHGSFEFWDRMSNCPSLISASGIPAATRIPLVFLEFPPEFLSPEFLGILIFNINSYFIHTDPLCR